MFFGACSYVVSNPVSEVRIVMIVSHAHLIQKRRLEKPSAGYLECLETLSKTRYCSCCRYAPFFVYKSPSIDYYTVASSADEGQLAAKVPAMGRSWGWLNIHWVIPYQL